MDPQEIMHKVIRRGIKKLIGPYRLEMPPHMKKIFLKYSEVGDQLQVGHKKVIITKIDDDIHVINKTLLYLLRGRGKFLGV